MRAGAARCALTAAGCASAVLAGIGNSHDDHKVVRLLHFFFMLQLDTWPAHTLAVGPGR